MLHSKLRRSKTTLPPSITTNFISLGDMMERKTIATLEFLILIETAGLSQSSQLGFHPKEEMATPQLWFEQDYISSVDGLVKDLLLLMICTSLILRITNGLIMNQLESLPGHVICTHLIAMKIRSMFLEEVMVETI